MTTLPQVYTPEDVAAWLGWSPRKLRAFAKEIGACRILGNRMKLTEDDIAAIMEASRPCPSKSTSEEITGIIEERLRAKSIAELQALRSEQTPENQRQKLHG